MEIIEQIKANVYRLDPSPDQAMRFTQWTGACRFAYNIALEQRRDYRHRAKLSYVQQCREITECRAQFEWLKDVPIHALQNALRNLDTAFQCFFAGVASYPQPHRKFQHESFTLSDPNYLGIKRLSKNIGAVKLPKVGWVRFRGWRPLGGDLRKVTVSCRAGHWYVAVTWRASLPKPAPSILPPVGIDRGVKVFAALSDGRMIAPRAAFAGIRDKLAKAQRKLARKQKFSANWRKQKAKITRLHSSAANARKDYLHKLSTDIAKSHGTVKIEKLRVRNMTASARGTTDEPGRNIAAKSGLNRSILDQGWGTFRAMLAYKLAERGGELIEVDPAYTSQTCAECGTIDHESRKDQATFACGHCGHADNADLNAARNILAARTIAPKPPKRTLKRVGKRNHPAAQQGILFL